ncbi:MAG: phosphoglucosamine mutase [Nanoarchaeota archaeon]|nr:phosphoglucosamine mutase [Nanoarchaeota archaeon]
MRELFGTDGIRGEAYKHPVTLDIAEKLGSAVALFSKKEKPVIVIGRDTRISGNDFEKAVAEGICKAGGKAVLLGTLPTPAVAYLTKKLKADAGIMISASHNPPKDNGLKVFSSEGFKLEDKDEEEIEKLMSLNFQNKKGFIENYENAKEDYIKFAKSSLGGTLEGLKIVIDCANGAACTVAKEIFEQLNAEVTAIHNQPDGNNINCNCGALHTDRLREEVIKQKADLGIALDGDADRIIVVDEKGNKLDGDYLLYICAKLLKDNNKLNKNTVVATVMSNAGFDEAVKKEDISVVKTIVGDKYVIEEMKKQGYNLGGEQSGHIILADYSTTGDGIICGLQIVKAMQTYKKNLSELAEGMKKYPQVLINVPVKEKKEIKTLKTYPLIQKTENELKNKGRILVRYSGTEMLLRVMVEAKENASQYAESIAENIRKEI